MECVSYNSSSVLLHTPPKHMPNTTANDPNSFIHRKIKVLPDDYAKEIKKRIQEIENNLIHADYKTAKDIELIQKEHEVSTRLIRNEKYFLSSLIK